LILAQVYFLQDRFVQAVEWSDRAAAHYTALGSPYWKAYCVALSAIAKAYGGERQGIAECLLESLDTLHRLGTRGMEAMVSGWLGMYYHLTNDPAKAAERLSYAREWFQAQKVNNRFAQ
jgi:hypothetical protein